MTLAIGAAIGPNNRRRERHRRAGTLPSGPSWTLVLDLTDFKRDLSELTDRLGDAQDCL